MISGLNNKKAQLGEQMMFFIFIFLLLVIGGGIVIGLYMFMGGEFNYYSVDANVLSEKIAACVESGALTGLESVEKENLNGFIMQRCNLNSEVIGNYNQIKICSSTGKPEDCINADNPIFSTGGDFTACGLTGGEQFLGCSLREAAGGGKAYSIIATSRQKIRSVTS